MVKRILLVEDNADTAFALSRLLRRSGYEVRVESTAAAARKAADEESFDIVVLDLGLPDGSGLDLFRDLKLRFPLLIGIAISGYAMEEDIRKSYAAGFVEHISKPFIFPHLLEVLSRI